MKAHCQIGLAIIGPIILGVSLTVQASAGSSSIHFEQFSGVQLSSHIQHCLRTRKVCQTYRHCDELKPRGYYSGCYWCTRNYRGLYYSALRTCSLSYMRYLRLHYNYDCNHYWVPKSYCRYYKRYRVCKVYCER